jgi:hypothetical protein
VKQRYVMARNGSVRPARHTLAPVLAMLAILVVMWLVIA